MTDGKQEPIACRSAEAAAFATPEPKGRRPPPA